MAGSWGAAVVGADPEGGVAEVAEMVAADVASPDGNAFVYSTCIRVYCGQHSLSTRTSRYLDKKDTNIFSK